MAMQTSKNMEITLHQISNPEFRQLLAERIRALADPTRIHLLHYLMQQEFCVYELAERVQKSQATVSKHLAILYRHGYISKRKDGVQTFYYANNEGLQFFCKYMCNSMQEHLQQIADIGQTSVSRQEEDA